EIETTEQNRLKSLMIKNSNIATLDDPYSISAGIEKGTKNRYNNIWPYDHARVKINECKEGDCDYVNAGLFIRVVEAKDEPEGIELGLLFERLLSEDFNNK
ncbi:14375_t:CDS:2, partial [Entrophospora sp. SA101]